MFYTAGEASYKRKRECFETTWFTKDMQGKTSLNQGLQMSPEKPWFLDGRWEKKATRNWFQLKVPSDSDALREKAKLIHFRHAAITMGLHYSLRWYWMGMCDVREIGEDEMDAQREHGIGWEGPEEWPDVLDDKVAPFTSLWLVRKNENFNYDYAEQLPRVVASPMFFNKERYDFVCCKMEKDDGSEGSEDWICQVVMFFMAYRPSECENGGKWEELAYVRWLECVTKEDLVEHKRKPVRDDNVVIWKRIKIANKAGVKMMHWAIHDDNGFQCFPHTTGWSVINCNRISHRVLMQPVNHESMDGCFWMNNMIYK